VRKNYSVTPPDFHLSYRFLNSVCWQHNCTINVEFIPPLPVSSPKHSPEEEGLCHQPTLEDEYPVGLYGSTENVFGGLVAPNVLGCSTLLVRPLATPLMK
jgi:hypothetical protein